MNLLERFLERFRRLYYDSSERALNTTPNLPTLDVDTELKEKINQIARASDNASVEFETTSQHLRRQAMALEQLAGRLGGQNK